MNTTVRIVLIIFLAAACLALVAYFLPTRDELITWVEKSRRPGVTAPAVFFVAYVLAALVGFSRGVLAIIAGLLFEPLVAVSVLFVSMFAAFLATFSVARYWLSAWVARRLRSMPIAEELMRAVEDHGFKVLVLMRVHPFLPGFVSGYGFGITRVKLRTYLIASIVGSVPLNLIYLYLGWAGGMAALKGEGASADVQQGMLIAGIIISLLLVSVASVYGRKFLTAVNTSQPRSSRPLNITKQAPKR